MAELFIILGALSLGSFANVFLYRYPKGISLLWPPSTCPQCGHRIRWRHNIPVLGWLLLRGHCADCGISIPLRYAAVEASFGLLAWLVLHRFGISSDGIYLGGFLSMLLAVAIVDWSTLYIFDVTTLPLLVYALAAPFIAGSHYDSRWASLAGALTLALVMLLLERIGRSLAGDEALGGGDVKLMAAVGAFLGPQNGLRALGLGILLALPLLMLYLKLKRLGWREPAPFGPGLALGSAIIAWNLFSNGSLDPWFGQLGLQVMQLQPSFMN